MSKKASNSQHYKVGIVTEAHGESLFATNAQGEVRQLSVGSAVYSDDKIESRDGSSMVVQASNGQTINIPDDVYDQMLSSAITKELSTALESSKENQSEDNRDPHTSNQPNTDHNAHQTDHSLNNTNTPENSVLQLNDVLGSEDHSSIEYWLGAEDTGIGSLSAFDVTALSTESIDFHFQSFDAI